jgi:hypothetical protein
MCYISFRTASSRSLSNPTRYRMIRRGRRLTSPTNNTHEQSIVNRLLHIAYYTSHIHIKILSIFAEQMLYTETEDCSLVRDLLFYLRSSMLTLRQFIPMVICTHIRVYVILSNSSSDSVAETSWLTDLLNTSQFLRRLQIMHDLLRPPPPLLLLRTAH